MIKALCNWLEWLSQKTGGFRLYLSFINFIVFGVIAFVDQLLTETFSIQGGVIVVIGFTVTSFFFATVIASFFEKRQTALRFLYCLLGIYAMGWILLLFITFLHKG